MLNYLKKFTMEILPSLAATIIGAYIVNHYVVSKPGTEAPVAAAVSTAQPKADTKPAEVKPAEATGDVASLPEAGVKAKGISEKGLLEKNAAAEKATVEKPAAEKPADKPPETTASVPAEPRRHQPREKTAVRVIPLTPAQPAATANPAPAVEAAVAPDERRDANDLARAAIDRLRNDGAARPQEAARAPETQRAPETPRNPEAARVVTGPTVRPLPPPIMVSSPPADPLDQQARAPSAGNARADDPHRPTPPAEIPTARPPLDLRAEMAPPREKTSVAEDVLSAAKSVFHAVLPK